MSNMISNLMAVVNNYDVIQICCYVVLGIMALCALFVIIVVLIQQGQSSGLGALGGTTDTFYGKNKGKSVDSKLKKATTACFVIMAVFSIAFFVLRLVLDSLG